jgi:GNAT superfamily N-acetyltransferase
MIRPATRADIPRLFQIRDGVRENRLTAPGAVTEADAERFIDAGSLWVWQEPDGHVAGFAAVDMRDGSIRALLVAPGHDGKGIGRALLAKACDALREAGHREAWLTAEPGSRAERHYRVAGWTADGRGQEGGLILRKAL